MKYKQIVRLLLVLVAVVILHSQCSTDYYYQSEVDIPETGWDYTKAAVFEPNIKDTSRVFNIIFTLGNTDEYRYSNIWFFVKTISPKGFAHIDTLEYFISTNTGKWVGNKQDDMWISKMYFKNSIRFAETGKYKFEVLQGMREDTLKGIKRIGVLMEQK